jgi:hypothetical protein
MQRPRQENSMLSPKDTVPGESINPYGKYNRNRTDALVSITIAYRSGAWRLAERGTLAQCAAGLRPYVGKVFSNPKHAPDDRHESLST